MYILTHWRRERFIRRTLRKVARQRVVGVAGNAWVIERAPGHDEKTIAALYTCNMRGWVEVLEEMPTSTITNLSTAACRFDGVQPTYRLTEGGWNAINRTQAWVVSTWLITFVTLFITLSQALEQHRAAEASAAATANKGQTTGVAKSTQQQP